MAAPPLSDDEIRFLEELTRRDVRFLVVGLAAAALQGAPAVTQDVDLWFRDLNDAGIRAALAALGAAYVRPGPSHPPLFAGRAVALFDVVVAMHGLESFDEEYERSLDVPIGAARVRVLPLERIVASKRATGRPKDRAILPVLEDAIRARDAGRG